MYILTPDDLVRQLKEVYKADYVLLAGYLRLIPPELCRAYENAMVRLFFLRQKGSTRCLVPARARFHRGPVDRATEPDLAPRLDLAD